MVCYATFTDLQWAVYWLGRLGEAMLLPLSIPRQHGQRGRKKVGKPQGKCKVSYASSYTLSTGSLVLSLPCTAFAWGLWCAISWVATSCVPLHYKWRQLPTSSASPYLSLTIWLYFSTWCKDSIIQPKAFWDSQSHSLDLHCGYSRSHLSTFHSLPLPHGVLLKYIIITLFVGCVWGLLPNYEYW